MAWTAWIVAPEAAEVAAQVEEAVEEVHMAAAEEIHFLAEAAEVARTSQRERW